MAVHGWCEGPGVSVIRVEAQNKEFEELLAA
jgi:hypothetical protein